MEDLVEEKKGTLLSPLSLSFVTHAMVSSPSFASRRSSFTSHHFLAVGTREAAQLNLSSFI